MFILQERERERVTDSILAQFGQGKSGRRNYIQVKRIPSTIDIMLGKAVVVGLFCTAMYYMLEYRDWLNWNRSFLYKVAPGPCHYVREHGGSEDMTHIGDGIVLISSGFDFGISKGTVLQLNVSSNEVTPMNIRGGPDNKEFMVNIHGITTWKEPKTGQVFLYVLSHPPSRDKIEVLEMTGQYELTYRRTITDPEFTYMNDLVAVGKDKFYITKFWKSREKFRHFVETMLRLRLGGIYYYDGRQARQMIEGLDMPNGINVSPDGKMVYTAEFNSKKLLAYNRDKSNMLTKAWEVDADTGVDNIEVDPDTGDLWIGCHPINYKILDSIYNTFGYEHPSQVLRFKIRDNMVSEIEEIYADDSSEIAGSTVATYVNGKLIVGSVRDKTLVCDVKYLSD